jgi:hypothetical protein
MVSAFGSGELAMPMPAEPFSIWSDERQAVELLKQIASAKMAFFSALADGEEAGWPILWAKTCRTSWYCVKRAEHCLIRLASPRQRSYLDVCSLSLPGCPL